MEHFKKEFLELLDKDLEFRYAVAGYLGLLEILKRLDNLAEAQTKLAQEQTRIWENITKIWEEIKTLREEHKKLGEEQVRLREDMNKLREDMLLGFKRHDEEIAKLREDMIAGFKRHDEELARLREDFNRMYRQFDARLSRVERTLEKITLDIEDEARIIVEYRLRELGYEVKIGLLILPEVELNIYGVSDELCIVGEASIRASSKIIDELNQKIDTLRKLYPNTLKPKIIKVVYTSLAMPNLTEKAEKEGIWVLKATGDIVKLKP